ncbi:unnamed protein product [Pocillopora meandrina]|uniref:Uncharacterized protein n=1 Tax=Pocillopora meandrina TaxID=46732 RepID=A0AAU9VPC8_9CNID|nr:unnamed protein product [Pocillopora meandrina]
MYFDVKHNSLLAHTGGKLLRTDQIGLPRSPRLRREYVLDGKNFAGSTKKVCYGRLRKERVSLLREMKVLQEKVEVNLKRQRQEKSNLEQIVHHLNSQKEGATPPGSVIAGKASGLVSLRGMQAQSDCRLIKSIRRPLAPEATRDHGNRLINFQSNLTFKEGSFIPRVVEREILRRRNKRLNAKRQEQLEGVKQREMQLADTVGVYTRINMTKGSLNYKGKPKYREFEMRTGDSHATLPRSVKCHYDIPSIELNQTASLWSKEFIEKKKLDNTYERLLPNMEKMELILPVQDNSTDKIFSVVSKQTRNECTQTKEDCEKCKKPEDNKVFAPKDLSEYRKDVFDGEIPVDFVAVEETSSVAQNTKTKNDLQRKADQVVEDREGITSTKNNSTKMVRTVRNKIIPLVKIQRQITPAVRKDQNDFYIDSVMKENNVTGNQAISELKEVSDEVDGEKSHIPLSTGKLQQLIRENVLGQSQKSSKRANKKTVLLTDYVRTLQKHMGIKALGPEIASNSPDFSATPFIPAGKRFGCDDEYGEEPSLLERRLKILQKQIIRLPATFTLIDGDLVED